MRYHNRQNGGDNMSRVEYRKEVECAGYIRALTADGYTIISNGMMIAMLTRGEYTLFIVKE